MQIRLAEARSEWAELRFMQRLIELGFFVTKTIFAKYEAWHVRKKV